MKKKKKNPKKTYELRIKAVNTFDKNLNKLCKDKLSPDVSSLSALYIMPHSFLTSAPVKRSGLNKDY